METLSLAHIVPSGEWFQQLPATPAEAAGGRERCVGGYDPSQLSTRDGPTECFLGVS